MQTETVNNSFETVHVGKSVSRYFKRNGISHREAAQRLGCIKQTVSNSMCDTTFKLRTATRYARTFGFNVQFLLSGKGELFSSGANDNSARTYTTDPRDAKIEMLLGIIRSQQETIRTLTEKLIEQN